MTAFDCFGYLVLGYLAYRIGRIVGNLAAPVVRYFRLHPELLAPTGRTLWRLIRK